jgi:tRNA (guanine-N7-)-methyltransferase
MAEAEPVWNFLGVEIREPLVIEANEIAAERGLANLHYEFCNAMIWLGKLIENIPTDIFQAVTIQFPDPWFKKKHAKRRMVNAELVETVVNKLAPAGAFWCRQDIEFLAEEMFEVIRAAEDLKELEAKENPFTIKTEREKAVEDKGLPVYRTMWQMNKPV